MVADGWYIYWDARGTQHVLEPGARMPQSVLDIVGAYRTRAEAAAAAGRRDVPPKAPTKRRPAAAAGG